MGSRGVDPKDCKYLKLEGSGKRITYSMHFRSLLEVVDFLRGNPTINWEAFTEARSETAAEAFAGPSLQQSLQYCIGGYDEKYDEFLEFAHRLDSVYSSRQTATRKENAFVGQRPNVPAYVAGAPKNMIRLRKVEQKKNVNVFMNVAFSAKMTESQIQHRGIITLNLIRVLEENGYIVNFRLFEACTVRDETFVCEIVLKRPGQKLEPRVCYFPMCGKSFERRIIARIKESMPFQYNWGMSYGSVLPEQFARNIMDIQEKDIYIGSPVEMNIKGENLYVDADAFMEKCNLQNYIVVPKYLEMINKMKSQKGEVNG